MIAELFRHGARHTLYNIFNEADVAKNSGMLTSVGMRQHYNLGKSIRKNYPMLFDESYNHSQFDVVSTHVPRTVESGISHLMGIYDMGSGPELTVTDDAFVEPPYAKSGRKLNKPFVNKWALPSGFRPIPIFAKDTESDTLLMNEMKVVCPNAQQMKKDTFAQYEEKVNSLLEGYSNELLEAGFDPQAMFGHDQFLVGDFDQLYDYHYAKLFQTGEIKKPMTRELFGKVALGYCLNFFSNWINEDIQKLWTHNITVEVIKRFEKKVTLADEDMTYFAMSGHDSNIAPFMMLTGLNSYECYLKQLETGEDDPNCAHAIPYASNIIFELTSVTDPEDSDKTDHLVRMLYNGKLMYGCGNMTDSKYEGYCTFQEYQNAAKDMFQLGDRYNEVCKGTKN